MVNNKTLPVFPEVCIKEASAGSGKTYALAKRYIQLLINLSLQSQEIPLRSILAITFTNKATTEMKGRILEFLKKIALDRFSDKEERNDLLSALRGREALVREKADMIMDYLIQNYNFFQVQTIDSFINALLSGCAFKIQLSPRFKIKRDYEDYLSYGLDILIDRAHRSQEILRIFQEFLSHYLYVEEKSSWFPKRDILSLVKSLFYFRNIFGGEFRKHPIESRDVILKKREILNFMRELRDNLPAGTNKRFATSLRKFLEENTDTFDIASLSSFFEKDRFPLNSGTDRVEKIDKLWKKIRSNLREVCELEAFSVFNPYVTIFNMVLGEFQALIKKEDILFLEELNKKAQVLFEEESITVAELYYRLATRFRHYLIDEFQDTSALQWRNLFPMIEEALSTGGSLFYVGDKKQAIYRFRGGEVALFDEVKEQFKDFNLRCEYLRKNYRSQKEIVEFNNEVFSEENLRRFIQEQEDRLKFTPSDIEEIVSVFRDAAQTYREDKPFGYVRMEHVEADEKEERSEIIKEKLIALVAELTERFSYRDLAILTRDNEEVELVTSWLLEEKIPVESEKTLNIRENAFIKEIISFLKFLNSPLDNLSFASFILGDIFLQVSGLNRRTIEDFIFAWQGKNAENTYLYREFQKAFPEIWDAFMDEFFKSVGFVPLYELLISILRRFKVMENFPRFQGFFMRFLELVKEQEEEHSAVLAFLEFFEKASEDDLYVDFAETEAVKVLTIHKAKGLEFPVVIIPFLKMRIKVGRERGEVIYPAGGSLTLVRLGRKYEKFSPALKRAYREEYKKSFIDELNNIYVALTRAKNELYVFIPRKKNSKTPELVCSFLPYKDMERGEKRIYPGEKEKLYPLEKIPRSEYRDWVHSLKDEFIEESQIRNRESILRGEILHCLLSFIENLYNQDQEEVLRNAWQKTRMRFPFVENYAEFTSLVKKLIEEETCKKFFYLDKGKIYLEKEIVDYRGHTRRIDRLVVKENEVWVIDYKRR
ncbi:MAG: UvrD-helicase domain-containing protein [Caldiserica bacterium]|nr:UvrD-helicase domain-containing protein [Caldisericota bacterium]